MKTHPTHMKFYQSKLSAELSLDFSVVVSACSQKTNGIAFLGVLLQPKIFLRACKFSFCLLK